MNSDNPKTRSQPDLGVEIAGIKLPTPLVTTSGTCGYADEYAGLVDFSALGAFVTKSITHRPWAGNAYPRAVETRAGMLNAIGMANVGVEKFIAEKVPLLGRLGVPVLVNISGATADEYVKVAAALADVEQISGLELNISCPNVEAGGLTFGADPRQVAELTRMVRDACGRMPLIVKLSPNVTDIAATAAAAVDAGADALSLVNTFTAMAIDIETRRPVLANVTGGLSGPAIHPIAVRMVHTVYTQVAAAAGVPIIGIGGVQHARDAVEFILAGATAVGVGTALFVDPTCIRTIRDGIADYLSRHNFASVEDLIGSMETLE